MGLCRREKRDAEATVQQCIIMVPGRVSLAAFKLCSHATLHSTLLSSCTKYHERTPHLASDSVILIHSTSGFERGKKPADTVLQTVKHRPLNSGQVQAEGPAAPAVIVKDNNPRCITLRVGSQELVMTV